MASGKSLGLLATAYNFQEHGIPFIILKSKIDTRDGENVIHSRALGDRECVSISQEDNIYNMIAAYQNIGDDQLGAMDGHTLIVLVESVLQVGEGDAGLDAAASLHKELFGSDGSLMLQHFVHEIVVLRSIVVVVEVGETHAAFTAHECVAEVLCAVVVVVDCHAGQGAGHVGRKHVAAVSGV